MNYNNIQDKYNAYREIAKDGDILLFHGKSLLSKSIQYFDDAYYNHSAVVLWNKGRLEAIDAWHNGVVKVPASTRIDSYSEDSDFCVLRPLKLLNNIEEGLIHLNNLWYDETKYYYLMLLRIAILKKLKVDITNIDKKSRTICSFLTREYTNILNIKCYKDVELITPQDFIRYLDKNELEILKF